MLAGFLGTTGALFGHGPLLSTFEAEIESGRVEVSIQLALPDLLRLFEMPETRFLGIEEDARASWARSHASQLAARFQLFTDDAFDPAGREEAMVRGPFVPDESRDPNDFAQQHLDLVLRFAVPARVGRLTFVQDFRHGSGHPIDGPLLLRWKGELLTFPAVLGPDFPLSIELPDDETFVPLARRDDLSGAQCGIECRPASGRLTIRKDAVEWVLVLPIPPGTGNFDSVLEDILQTAPDISEGLKAYLTDRIVILIGGRPLATARASLRLMRPISEGRSHSGAELSWARIRTEGGWVEFTLTAPASGHGPVEATWTTLNPAAPFLVAEISNRRGSSRWMQITNPSKALRCERLP